MVRTGGKYSLNQLRLGSVGRKLLQCEQLAQLTNVKGRCICRCNTVLGNFGCEEPGSDVVAVREYIFGTGVFEQVGDEVDLQFCLLGGQFFGLELDKSAYFDVFDYAALTAQLVGQRSCFDLDGSLCRRRTIDSVRLLSFFVLYAADAEGVVILLQSPEVFLAKIKKDMFFSAAPMRWRILSIF